MGRPGGRFRRPDILLESGNRGEVPGVGRGAGVARDGRVVDREGGAVDEGGLSSVRLRRRSASGRRHHRRTGARRWCGSSALKERFFDAGIQTDHSANAEELRPPGHGYRVRIEYTEPEFHRRNPHCPEAYTALFDCADAGSRREAIDMALMDFDQYARMSRVRWRRIVRAITVE